MAMKSNVRELAEKRGLKPIDLAHKANISRQIVYSYFYEDLDDKRLRTIVAIAKALDVPVDALFTVVKNGSNGAA